MKQLRILLLRHGNSDYNTISEVFSTSANVSIPFHKYSDTDVLTDSALSFQGLMEIKNSSKFLEDFPIKYIFISPLRRCLESSYYLTKDRVNKKFELKVQPELRESLMSHNDFPIYWKNAYKLNRYSNYDFSEMKKYKDDDLWFIRFLEHDQNFRQKMNVLEQFVTKKNLLNEKIKFISTLMRGAFPESVENNELLGERTLLVKEILNDFVNYKKDFENIIVKDHEILLITHFNFINQFCFEQKDLKKFYTKFLTTGALIDFNLKIS